MHTSDLRTASLNDMVFEGRNKAYGAYVLRQLYHRHLASALTLAVALSLVLLVSPILIARLFPKPIEAAELVDLPGSETVLIAPPAVKSELPAARAEATVRPPLATTPTKVVRDELAKPAKEVAPIAPAVGPLVDPGFVGLAGAEPGAGTGVGAGTGSVDSGTAKAAGPPAPFLTAEVMPEFVGGNAALVRYLQKNLRYPAPALRNSIEGKVYIAFTVQSDGSIADVQVLKGLGFGADEEAARVVKNMPAWIPGQQNKHTVAVRYTLPITFRYE